MVWADLSDDELHARLVQRGCPPAWADEWARRRERYGNEIDGWLR